YLRDVLTSAARVVRPGGHIFVSDVRNLDLTPLLFLDVVLREAGSQDAGQVGRTVSQRLERDEHLAVRPRFFHDLVGKVDRVSGVSLLPRTGRHLNDLALYRYDVVIEVAAATAEEISPLLWEWDRDGLSTETFRRSLAAAGEDQIIISDVPDARLTG